MDAFLNRVTITLMGGPMDGYKVKVHPDRNRVEVKQPVFDTSDPLNSKMIGEKVHTYQKDATGVYHYVASEFTRA